MEQQHKGWFKELLEWLHHAYWVREFVLSSGIWAWAVTWAVKHAYLPPDYKWPLIAILVGLSIYLLALARSLWPVKKAPTQLQGVASLVVNPTNTGLPADVNIDEFFRMAYRSPALEPEVRKNFLILAEQKQPHDHEKFYLDFIGVGFIAVGYDNIWWPMYASQLDALMEVNRNGGILPIARVKDFGAFEN